METIDDIRQEESASPTSTPTTSVSPANRLILGGLIFLGIIIAVFGAISFFAPLFIIGLLLAIVPALFLRRRQPQPLH